MMLVVLLTLAWREDHAKEFALGLEYITQQAAVAWLKHEEIAGHTREDERVDKEWGHGQGRLDLVLGFVDQDIPGVVVVIVVIGVVVWGTSERRCC